MSTPTAPMTRYEVCATILDKAGEVHTKFYRLELKPGEAAKSFIQPILAARFAKDRKPKNVSVISVTEIEEEL